MEQLISISTLKPESIVRKDAFRRALPDIVETFGSSSPDYEANLRICPIKYQYVSQDVFLREFDPHSHAINSIKAYPNAFTLDKQSHRYKMKVRTRVAVADQRKIHAKRLVALTGYDCDIKLSSSQTDGVYQEGLKLFKEGWADKGIDTLIHLAIASDFKVGDVAVVGYKQNGKFGTRIFAYDRGDILYPHYDPLTGELAVFGRRFTKHEADENGNTTSATYLDVYDSKDYMQYVRRDDGKWEVSIEPKSHAFPFIPVAYHRYGEPVWAGSQDLIEHKELALSQLAENNRQYALRILYALGADFEMEADSEGTPTQINSSSTDAKIGFLDSADKSTSFELEIKTLDREIMRGSFAVETPELKSGSDVSSLTVKMLFNDAYVKAVEDAHEYQAFLDKIVEIHAEGYGVEIGKQPLLTSLKISAKLTPWVYMSETEVVNTLVQLVAVGVLSKRSATQAAYEMLGYGSIDETERVLQEAHDELVATTTVATDNSINNFRNSQ